MDVAAIAPPLIATLFGDAPPTWTDKEVIKAVAGAVAMMAPVTIFLIQHFVANARKAEQEKSGSVIDELRNLLAKLQSGGPQATDEEARRLATELEAVKCKAARLAEDANTSRLGFEKKDETVRSLEENLTSVQNEFVAAMQELEAHRRRIKRAVRKDGHSWSEKVLSGAPEFKPLDERRTPVIATLNLKGGVGKTTITANTGVALAKLGYRVLLLDLDLQGSLTGLFVSPSEQRRVYDEGRLLGDFLFASFEGDFPKLTDYCLPVSGAEGSAIVPTTDRLAYAETNLAIRWLLREHNNRDPRFLLRRELHLKRITQAFDVVLLDCPPLINMCCVNALTVADYLVIPVLPSKQTTDRVPVLFQRIKEFRENLNPELKVMGVLPNRTQRSHLTHDEENRFSLLRRQCRNVWGMEVPQFNRSIPMQVAIRKAEDQNRTLHHGEPMFPLFLELAQELAGRLPTFCQPRSKQVAESERLA